MEKMTLNVEGMSCDHCVQAVKNADPDEKTPAFFQVCYNALLMLLRDI